MRQHPLSTTTIRIGTKLGFSVGIGIILVAGMVASEQINSNSVETMVAAADRQQAIVNESIVTEGVMQSAEIVGRDIRKARSAKEVGGLVGKLGQISAQLGVRFASLVSLTADADARNRFQDAQRRTRDYIDALHEIGGKQTEILSLFQRLDETESKWARSINLVVNSEAFARMSNTSIEAYINEAESAFKDARTATWRYLVLSEPLQVMRISAAADQAEQKLVYARRDATDQPVMQSIDLLRAIVPEYMAILKSTTDTIDGQNLIQRDRANPAEDTSRNLLSATIAMATQLSDRATVAATAAAAQAGRIRIIVGLVVTMLLAWTAAFASLAIGKPIRIIGDVLMRLANGDKAVAVPYTERGDEIGDTARVANIFKSNLLRLEQFETEQKQVEERLRAERKLAMDRLADTFEQTVGEIVNAVSSTATELERSASFLTQTADTTQQLTCIVSSAAEQASNNVKSVSQATDEISAAAGEISRQVQESTMLSSQAVQQAQTTDRRMAELLDAASRIGDVVDLISAVAGQTNLLALNATIEAARAGEAGRGFAVVASEVKTLAQRTAAATQEISNHVSGIQNATRDSVSALQEIGGTIGRLAVIASAIASAVEEQDATTQEISRNVRQVAHGTSEVASNISDVNQAASQTGLASTSVLSSAQALAAEGSRLRMEAGKFLATVRATG